MRTKFLQLFFEKNKIPSLKPYVYEPSNLDFVFDSDGMTLKKSFDIVGYNSQFDARSFSLSVMKDAGIDINSLKGINLLPRSSFYNVQSIISSDSHE